MEQIYRNEMKRNIDLLVKGGRMAGKAVFAFGHCNATEEMIDYLFASKINVAAILDNNESKQGSAYRAVYVKSPGIIQAYDASGSIVLIASRFYAPMSAQLRRLGYNGDIVRVVDYNSFAEYSLSGDTFSCKRDRVLRGAQTLKEIKKKYPSQHLVICPGDALGDVYWALSFLPAYCGKHRINEVAVAVISNGCRQVAGLFNVRNVLAFERAVMDELVQAILFTREENCIIAHHDRPYTDNIIRYLDKHFLSFTDYYKYAVYGLDKYAEPVPPSGHADFSGKAEIDKGNTVIISPYAKSVAQLPDSFWESLAGEYAQKGYLVCTNVTGCEAPVKGTKPLSLPINQITAAAEYAGCFIGIRSGLCDILAAAGCRKVAVFPDCIYSTTNVKVDEFFDMPGWEKIIWRP